MIAYLRGQISTGTFSTHPDFSARCDNTMTQELSGSHQSWQRPGCPRALLPGLSPDCPNLPGDSATPCQPPRARSVLNPSSPVRPGTAWPSVHPQPSVCSQSVLQLKPNPQSSPLAVATREHHGAPFALSTWEEVHSCCDSWVWPAPSSLTSSHLLVAPVPHSPTTSCTQALGSAQAPPPLEMCPKPC